MEIKIDVNVKCPIVGHFDQWRRLLAREVAARACGSKDADKFASRRLCIECWWAGDPSPQEGYNGFVYDMGSAFTDYVGRLETGLKNLPTFLYDTVDGGYEVKTDFPCERLDLKRTANDVAAICQSASSKWLDYVFLFQDRMTYTVSARDLMATDNWKPVRYRYIRIMRKDDWYGNRDKWKDWELLRGTCPTEMQGVLPE